MKYDEGFITFDSIGFDLHQSVSQAKMEHDRAESSDIALVVENYITNQRNFASKRMGEEKVILSMPIQPKPEKQDNKILQNGSIIKIGLEHYISYKIKPETQVITLPHITVAL